MTSTASEALLATDTLSFETKLELRKVSSYKSFYIAAERIERKVETTCRAFTGTTFKECLFLFNAILDVQYLFRFFNLLFCESKEN